MRPGRAVTPGTDAKKRPPPRGGASLDREEVEGEPEIGADPYVRFAMDARGTSSVYPNGAHATRDLCRKIYILRAQSRLEENHCKVERPGKEPAQRAVYDRYFTEQP